MDAWAVITGASSGIGLELARCLAADGYHLVLTARRKDRLDRLKQELEDRYRIRVLTIAQDLSLDGAAGRIAEALGKQGMTPDILINNAGLGDYGQFAVSDPQKMSAMLNVNIIALSELTRLLLPGMIGRGKGRVMNVASMAGFVPGPLMAVYYASKAYVVSLSQALAEELKGTGVTVTALCPGPVKTEFQAVAYGESAEDTRARKIPTAAETAEAGIRAMKRGQMIVVPGGSNQFTIFLTRILPRSTVLKLVRLWQEKSKSSTESFRPSSPSASLRTGRNP